VQLTVLAAVSALNVIGLVLINRHKREEKGKDCEIPWLWRRRAYGALIATSFSLSWWLDVHYDIHPLLLPVKSYVMAFPLGLLDLHFSSTTEVSLKVLAGAALWCSTIYVRLSLVDAYYAYFYGARDGVPPVLVRECTPWTLARELLRYVLSLPFMGILSDLIFSPMHRLAHHPFLYKDHHKVHHEYTNKLTALVLYHGALLDDFLMPVCTSVGGTIYAILLGFVGLERQAFSSVAGYLIVFNTLLSHAHDTRCARLMAPLPDDLNFVAYHYVHHLSPGNNFGLTRPSDVVWDKLLGVSTIKRLEDFEQSSEGKRNFKVH